MTRLLAGFALLLAVAACTSSGASASATASAAPSVAPSAASSAAVSSPQDAARAVIGANPIFASLREKDPNLIGQCCWYEVTPGPDGDYQVDVEIGWGDCPSGCIDRHHWTYHVTRDGAVTLTGETGPSMAPDIFPGGPS
jgi:hypothetical protein